MDLRGRLPLRRPVVFTVLITIVYVALLLLGSVLGPVVRALVPGLDEDVPLAALGGKILGSVLVLVLARRLGFLTRSGLRGGLRGARLLWVPAVLIVVTVVGNVSAFQYDPARSLVSVADRMLTGFAEEGIFRGIVLGVLLAAWAPRGRRGMWQAVALSSAVFGASHALNIVVGADVVGTLSQVLYAALIGVGFAAIRLRAGTVWGLALVHGLLDTSLASFVDPDQSSSGGVGAAVQVVLLLGLPVAAYGLYLLRRRSGTLLLLPSPTDDTLEPRSTLELSHV